MLERPPAPPPPSRERQRSGPSGGGGKHGRVQGQRAPACSLARFGSASFPRRRRASWAAFPPAARPLQRRAARSGGGHCRPWRLSWGRLVPSSCCSLRQGGARAPQLCENLSRCVSALTARARVSNATRGGRCWKWGECSLQTAGHLRKRREVLGCGLPLTAQTLSASHLRRELGQ